MGDRDNRPARLRYTATGALAALVAAGAIAGTVALADSPPANAPTPAAAATGPTKTAPGSTAPGCAMPGKTPGSQPSASPQPFLNAIERLVDNGTITAAEGQAVDREIMSGRVDTDTLASAGFTPAQLQAVQQALASTKGALAAAAPRTPK